MHEVMSVDGIDLTVRPIRVTDAEGLARMFGRLSRASIYFRFFSPVSQLPPAMLLRLTEVDHRRRDALVAVAGDEIVAVARYDEVREVDEPPTREAELAVTVEDAWQRRGLGQRLVRRLEMLARRRGYDGFVARILPENRAALELVHKLAPDATVQFNGGDYEARLPFSEHRARVMDGYLRASRGTRA
jgi:GNAT superfamily N-acetyltransferase